MPEKSIKMLVVKKLACFALDRSVFNSLVVDVTKFKAARVSWWSTHRLHLSLCLVPVKRPFSISIASIRTNQPSLLLCYLAPTPANNPWWCITIIRSSLSNCDLLPHVVNSATSCRFSLKRPCTAMTPDSKIQKSKKPSKLHLESSPPVITNSTI